MRYIGSKAKLIDEIESFILDKVETDGSQRFLDLFSGTGIVAKHFKKYFEVITNDSLYFSYILSKGHVIPNSSPSFNKLNQNLGITDPLAHLNSLKGISGFISENYSSDDNGRMYFIPDNAKKIDDIRLTLNQWLEQDLLGIDEFDYLLATLIEAVPYISNTTGTYGAYLKHWDKRAFKPLLLEYPILFDNNKHNIAFNEKAENLTQSIKADICYIDPPYNGRQYTSNYHLLETIAKYDHPEVRGVTGIRNFDKDESSDFCKKSKVYEAFKTVLSQMDCKHLFISYSADGLLSKEQIEEILLGIGKSNTYDFKSISYRLYKSKIVLKPKVDEYLFYIQK